jgi:hypothetical protein
MSIFHYHDAGRGESLDLYYEDDKVALNTSRDRDDHLFNGHEVMLPPEVVDDLIKHLTIMRDSIKARFTKPQLEITAKEPKS